MQRGQSQGALPSGNSYGENVQRDGEGGGRILDNPASVADAINHNKRPHCAQGSRTIANDNN